GRGRSGRNVGLRLERWPCKAPLSRPRRNRPPPPASSRVRCRQKSRGHRARGRTWARRGAPPRPPRPRRSRHPPATEARVAAGGLEPRETAELPLLADVLGDSSTWAEPGAGLEAAVARAVADAEPITTMSRTPTALRTSRRRRRMLVSGVAAAAVIAIVVAT